MITMSRFVFVLLSVATVCLADDSFKCEDDPSVAANCQVWKDAGGCQSQKVWMKRYCAKTCDDCSPPSPPIPNIPDCAKTTFGCCWDNVTAAQAPTTIPSRSQCLPCLNKRSSSFCKRFEVDCTNTNAGQGDFMRSNCPTTCGVPCDHNLNIHSCKDLDLKNCIAWYKDGKCNTDQEAMRVHCPAMCGFCQTAGN